MFLKDNGTKASKYLGCKPRNHLFTKDHFTKIKRRVLGYHFGIMASTNTPVNGRMALNTETEYGKISLVISILDSGPMEKYKAMEFT